MKSSQLGATLTEFITIGPLIFFFRDEWLAIYPNV